MKYQESGRFGRITKHLRKHGFEKEMEDILLDSDKFTKLKKPEQTRFVETVVTRMVENIGEKKSEKVLFDCGAQCCGKSWSGFVKRIYDDSGSLDEFFKNLNEEEKKYNTTIRFNSDDKIIIVARSKCICGLINKGAHFESNSEYCKCSLGHMSQFFNTVFSVKELKMLKSIYSGDDTCEWEIKID